MMSALENAGWITGFGLIAFLIIASNVMTMVAFYGCKNLLRMRSSYFLINLAAADLLVGAISIPMLIILLCYQLDSVTYRNIYTAVDVTSGFASVFTLTAIGLERLYAFCWPLRQRTVLNNAKYLLVICVVWTLAFAITSLHLLYKYHGIPYDMFFYVMMSCLGTCLFFICVSYIAIWIRMKLYFSLQRRPSANDKKVTRMLLGITLIFVLTWLPFYLLNIINFFCNSCVKGNLSPNVVFFCKLLHYANSFINPVIFTFQMSDFRAALAKKLCKSCYDVAEEIPKIKEIPLN
ncbi:beta-1 adrenergic receptor-like [Montipora capricornis]|uniref:beta-1 adrenergic receptor-like n=1 Tax=Montipora capricornis TaxID=246305 RepID=UPI0035F14595